MENLIRDLTHDELREVNAKEPITTTPTQFAGALEQLGIVAGTQLVVHTSLASLGHFDGGAEAYCQTLMDTVTEKGTLMMPGLVAYPADGVSFCYDPRTTPCSVGIAPETFRKMAGVVRSWDPTHSICVWGRNKEEFVRKHHLFHTMHKDSPLGLLEQAGGYCLTVGCWHNVTFMHVVETTTCAHCLGTRTELFPAVLPGVGEVKLHGWGWRKGACRALRHEEIFGWLRENNAVRELTLAHSHLVYFKLADYRKAYSRLLNGEENGCNGCATQTRCVDRTVPTDWDEERQAPMANTDAFTGPWRNFNV